MRSSDILIVILSFSLLFAAIGFFVYGGIEGAIAIFLLAMLSGFALVVALIPLLGSIIHALAMLLMFPIIYELTGIYDTWLTALVFIANLLIGICVCYVSTMKTRSWNYAINPPYVIEA